MINIQSYKRGFTLIETVVAISILMLGTIGPMTLAQRNLKASRDAADRLVASFLAQEGIEVVRNAIANNSADTSDATQWLNAVITPPGAQCDKVNGYCVADITRGGTNLLEQCNGPACSPPTVYQDSGTFVYRQTSGPVPGAPWLETKYQRLIEVEVIENGKRITASTTVWWPKGNITLKEDIYNWFFQIN